MSSILHSKAHSPEVNSGLLGDRDVKSPGVGVVVDLAPLTVQADLGCHDSREAVPHESKETRHWEVSLSGCEIFCKWKKMSHWCFVGTTGWKTPVEKSPTRRWSSTFLKAMVRDVTVDVRDVRANAAFQGNSYAAATASKLTSPTTTAAAMSLASLGG
jgi:hypothetical protein